jgi:predicted nucleic acid-binding protein
VLRIVFDTNVAVALVVFADPRLDALAAGWKVGAIEAVVDDGTLAEFDRVLHYPELKLDPPRIEAARDAYRAVTVPLSRVDLPDPRGSRRALPRCSDPDDQMFLVLTDAARADCLLTRDRALLKLGRARYGLPFRIALPEAIVLPPQCGSVASR